MELGGVSVEVRGARAAATQQIDSKAFALLTAPHFRWCFSVLRFLLRPLLSVDSRTLYCLYATLGVSEFFE